MATATAPNLPDVRMQNEGSLFIFWPNTPVAIDWFEEHTPGATRWAGNGVVVEHRYVSDIYDALVGDGLEVQ